MCFFYHCIILIHCLHHNTYSSIFFCDCGTLVLFEIAKCSFICFLLLRRQAGVIFVISFSCKNGQKMSLSQVQRAQIVTLYREGYSERKISAKCNVSKTAVSTAIINW